jgi:hypothetical protein
MEDRSQNIPLSLSVSYHFFQSKTCPQNTSDSWFVILFSEVTVLTYILFNFFLDFGRFFCVDCASIEGLEHLGDVKYQNNQITDRLFF